MKKQYKAGLVVSFCAAAALLLSSGAWAAHPDAAITFKDGDGFDIGPTSNKAFSLRYTCNGGCHPTHAIERHSYHAQLGANQHMGWNAFKYGNWNSVAAKKKPWVQSPGHVGKW